MQDFIHFIIKYWYFSIPFVISVVLLIIEEARTKGMFKQINPNEATILINRKDAIVLDIREKSAFKEGHIINAMNIPKADLAKQSNKLEAYKGKPIIVTCLNGQQSGAVVMELRKQGFDQAVALAGGIQAWQRAGMPTTVK